MKSVFVQFDRQILFSNGLTREYHPKVNTPYIPFAITEFDYVKELPEKMAQ